MLNGIERTVCIDCKLLNKILVEMLPSLVHLKFGGASIDTRQGASGALQFIPRSVWMQNPKCCFADFADETSLVFDIDDDDTTVALTVRGGEFGFEIPVPNKSEKVLTANNAPGVGAWESAGVKHSIAKSIVAFAAYVRLRFSWVERVEHGNTAVVDADVELLEGDDIRKEAEATLYRVR